MPLLPAIPWRCKLTTWNSSVFRYFPYAPGTHLLLDPRAPKVEPPEVIRKLKQLGGKAVGNP